MDKRINFQYFADGCLNEFSFINMAYFEKIVNLCKDYNVEIILLNAPLHPYYKKMIPAEYESKYSELINCYKLAVIDFSSICNDDCCFTPDGDHVSLKGAMEVTEEIRKLIKIK
jgi:hypothetical protein